VHGKHPRSHVQLTGLQKLHVPMSWDRDEVDVGQLPTIGVKHVRANSVRALDADEASLISESE